MGVFRQKPFWTKPSGHSLEQISSRVTNSPGVFGEMTIARSKNRRGAPANSVELRRNRCFGEAQGTGRCERYFGTGRLCLPRLRTWHYRSHEAGEVMAHGMAALAKTTARKAGRDAAGAVLEHGGGIGKAKPGWKRAAKLFRGLRLQDLLLVRQMLTLSTGYYYLLQVSTNQPLARLPAAFRLLLSSCQGTPKSTQSDPTLSRGAPPLPRDAATPPQALPNA